MPVVLDWIRDRLFRLSLRCDRNAKPWVFGVIAFTALIATQAIYIEKKVSFEDQLEPDVTSSRQLSLIKDQFPHASNLLLLVQDQSPISDRKKICDVIQTTERLRWDIEGIRSVQTPLDLRRAHIEQNILTYPKVLSDPCMGMSETRPWLEALSGGFFAQTLTHPKLSDYTIEFTIAPAHKPGEWGHYPIEAVRKILSTYENIGNHFFFGDYARDFYVTKGMQFDQALNGALAVAILFALKWVFGTWVAGLYYIATLGITSGVLLGLMGLFRQPLDVLGACIIILLALALLEDFVYLSFLQIKKPGYRLSAFRRLLMPSFFTSLTTIIGFGSLCLSDLEIVRRFGFWAAIGVALEWFVIFFVLPPAIRAFRWPESWVKPKPTRILSVLERVSLRAPSRSVVKITLIVFLILPFLFKKIRIEQDPVEMFSKGHPLRLGIEHLEKTRGWTAITDLVFNPDVDDATKSAIIEKTAKNPLVTLIVDRKKVLDWTTAQVKDPETRKMVEREFSASTIAERFTSREGYERASVYVKSTNTLHLDALRREVETICGTKCFLGGGLVAFADFSQVFLRTLFESLLATAILVGIILWILSTEFDLRTRIALLVSSFWGPAVLIALIQVSQVPINSVTCIVAAVLTGLTGDNAIQFIFASRRGRLASALASFSGAAVVITVLMMLIGAVLLGSYFDPVRKLGWLLEVGFLVILVGDLWVLKGLAAPEAGKPASSKLAEKR